MTTLKLKPQWMFRSLSGDRLALTSENFHQELPFEYAAILQKLVTGIESDTLNDAEFDQIEYLSGCGFLTVDSNPDAPVWELSGVNFHSVQEQLRHTTFSVIDLTPNKVSSRVVSTLLESGMVVDSDKPKLILVFANSYQELNNYSVINVLPIICNRMRLSIGPMLFPWGPHVGEAVRNSEHYLPAPNYSLPVAFDLLQSAWIAASVVSFIAKVKLNYASHFVELDMTKMETAQWPAKS